MGLARVIYTSRPFGFDAAMLHHILSVAQSNNLRDDITGALICRADIYLQLLEGPEAAVEAAYGRIEEDDRHVEVTQLVQGPVTERLFPEWAMRDDPAQSWMWSQADVAAGAVTRASADEVLDVFKRLPVRQALLQPDACPHQS